MELVARVGEDGAGEELLLALARSGVGHLAVLRDPARPTALVPVAPVAGTAEDDLDDARELLADEADAAARAVGGAPACHRRRARRRRCSSRRTCRSACATCASSASIVAVEPLADGGAAVVEEAAAYAGAALVVVASPGRPAPDGYAAATVLEAPADDPGGAFARLVGEYAAALDRGVDPGEAFRAAAQGGGWEAAAD